MKRVLVTAGGTGGHIYPLVAVISELQSEASRLEVPLRIRYVGAAGEQYRKVIADNGVEVRSILGSKFRRYFSLANVVDVPKLLVSLLQALWHLYWFMPHVVFSKGGPGSIPVVLAARFYRVPVVVHETDSIPSITTRIESRFAAVTGTSFPGTAKYLEGRRGEIVFVGNPVRQYLLEETMPHEEAKASFGFDKQSPLILVLGGSQGAVRINDFILDNLYDILPVAQVLHQTGELGYEGVIREFGVITKDLPEQMRARYRAVGHFEEDIRIAFAASDLVVSRAGGGIFEIAAFRKPSILIPIASSANNHQLHNALAYQDAGAAVVFEEDNLLPNLFLSTVEKLFSDPDAMVSMSKAAASFYKPDAALNLARIVLRAGGVEGQGKGH